MREDVQALAVGDDSLGIACRNVGRCRGGDIAEERRKLFLGLRRENDAVDHRALACSAASLARTWSAVTARDGLAFNVA